MPLSPSFKPSLLAEDRRLHPRHIVDEEGLFVMPGENMAIPCQIVNISVGGAKIMCDAIPQPETKVLLILTNGECFEAVTARYGEGELALKFTQRR
jgi:hypothetical protein